MLVSGCLMYKTRQEKKEVKRQLMKEFNGKVKIHIQDKFLTYTAIVDRTHL